MDDEPEPAPQTPQPQPAPAPVSRTFTSLWKMVGGIALLVGLIGGVLSLWDRHSSKEPKFKGELSQRSIAAAFIKFTKNNDGRPVQLDLSCSPKTDSTACIPDPALNGSPGMGLVLWVFPGPPCFTGPDDYGEGVPRCDDGRVLFIRTEDSDAVVAGGSTGAGSIVVRGRFVVRTQGPGGTLFPPNVSTTYLTAISAK